MKVIVRMWTAEGYHKDVSILSAEQVHMSVKGMEARIRYLIPPLDASRVVVDPNTFPEAVEFEIIVQK